MIEDVVHPHGVPHRVRVVREGGRLALLGGDVDLRRRGNRRRSVVVGVDERQQVAIGVHRALIDRLRPLLVPRDVVHAPGDEHDGSRDPLQPVGVPEPALHPPRRDRDRRLDARIHGLAVVGIRRAALRQQPVRRRAGDSLARLAVAAADDVDDAVAAHRVADDAGAGGVEASGEKAAGARLAEARHLVQHEQLIECAVVERAGERLLIVVGAFPVIDRHGDEALAREVLGEMAHQVAIAGIAVRDDHERKRRLGRQRRGVADRLAVQRRGDRGIARNRAVIAARLLPGGQRRRIPDLERQRAVVARGRPALFRAQDVRPVPVGRLQRAHADRVVAIGGKLGRRRRHGVDAVRLRERAAGGGEDGSSKSQHTT